MADLTLKYKRVGHEYNGAVVYDTNKTLHVVVGASFEKLCTMISSAMATYDQAKVFFQRTEREGLQPVEITGEEYVLLKTDPKKFAEDRTVEHQVVHIRDKKRVGDELHINATVVKKSSVPSIKVTVRAGLDTLADAFGDEVFVKMKRGGLTECPACGRWKGLSQGSNGYGTMFCKLEGGCGLNMPVRFVPLEWGGWSVMKTEILLDVGEKAPLERYYLPRAWNESGPWISHEDLKQKYEQYLKEKSDAVSR